MGIDVRRIGGRIGAEVTGVDLASEVPAAVTADLRAALNAHQVLVLRDQRIDDAAQLRFAAGFGPLTDSHPLMRADDRSPQVLPVDGEDQRANHWHTDISFLPRPSMGTTLRSVVLPPYGGDTLVANAAAGYRDLPAELRAVADRLWAVHTNRAEQPRLGTERGEQVRRAFFAQRFEAAHPVVRVHPETGDPALFLGGFAQRLVGMTLRDSRPILDVLQSYVRRPENVVRWTWRPGDVLVFDNRCTQHYGVDDYGRHPRLLHRVSITGGPTVALDGRTGHAITEEAA